MKSMDQDPVLFFIRRKNIIILSYKSVILRVVEQDRQGERERD
jgi:hypothetical protein